MLSKINFQITFFGTSCTYYCLNKDIKKIIKKKHFTFKQIIGSPKQPKSPFCHSFWVIETIFLKQRFFLRFTQVKSPIHISKKDRQLKKVGFLKEPTTFILFIKRIYQCVFFMSTKVFVHLTNLKLLYRSPQYLENFCLIIPFYKKVLK